MTIDHERQNPCFEISTSNFVNLWHSIFCDLRDEVKAEVFFKKRRVQIFYCIVKFYVYKMNILNYKKIVSSVCVCDCEGRKTIG